MKSFCTVALLWLLAWGPSAHAQPAIAPPCASMDACLEALAHGHYDAARSGLSALRRGPTRAAASVALARLELETGHYERAVDLTRPIARRSAEGIAAGTLLGEAELAQGRLDEAQRAFEAAASEPAGHRARVLLGRLLIRRGRAAQARQPLMALVQAYNDESIAAGDAEGVAYVAMAAQMLESPQDANEAFVESNEADPRRVETQLEWGELFLSHYDTGHAEESVRMALEVNPNSARGQTLLARVLLTQSLDFIHAEEALARALAINPNLVRAHVTRAGIAIRDMDLDAASAHLDAALAVDSNDLEALSVRAAVAFLRGNDARYRRALREVFTRNAHYSDAYSIIAEYAEWEHRYPRIVEMAREALRVNPEDARAHATLGITLLRMGREEAGLAALREAWRRDHFNVRVYNLLELWDRSLTPDYELITAGPFTFRLNREERAVMLPTLSTTLGGAWDDMRRRYGFTPQTPVQIELFSTEAHFSVRTSGLPNAGVQGVCFGQVITALSPRAGPFNWGQITWHELAHVFHIQLSRNRVPRWFTEGLAEYETMIARPEWQREEDHRLYLALAADRLPPVAELNHAFTHARTRDAITVAYYASSMLVKYIVDQYGFDRIPRMLRAWATDQPSETVIERVLGISIEELDHDFRAHTRQRLSGRASDFTIDFAAYADLDAIRAAAEQHPADADAQASLAAALTVHGGDPNEAMTAVRGALRRDASHPVARFIAARLALARRDLPTARADLRRLFASGRDGYEPRIFEARVAMASENTAAAQRAFEAAAAIDPARHEAWQGLQMLAQRTENRDLAARVLRQMSQLDQHSRDVNFAMLQRSIETEDWVNAREYGERGVLVDPFHAESRRLYAEALLHEPSDAREALVQVDLALAAEPETPASVHLTRARVLMALRRRRDAQRSVEAAVAADPSVAAEGRAIVR